MQQQLQAEPSARTETLESVEAPKRGYYSARGRGHGQNVSTRGSHKTMRGGSTTSVDNTPGCRRCRKACHAPGANCPAVCHRSNRKGHYQTQCFSKTVELKVDTAFLGVVSDGTVTTWTVSIRVENRDTLQDGPCDSDLRGDIQTHKLSRK